MIEKITNQNQIARHKLAEKINQLIDAVNGILDYAPLEMAMKAEPAELDIPKSYKNDQLTLATLDYSKKLEKENSELKDEVERIKDALYEAKYALEEIITPTFVSHEQEMAQEALDKVNAEIKALTGE